MTIDLPRRAKAVRIDSEYVDEGWQDVYSLRTPKGEYRKLLRKPPATAAEILRWFRSLKVTHVVVPGGWHAARKSKLYSLNEFEPVLRKLYKETK